MSQTGDQMLPESDYRRRGVTVRVLVIAAVLAPVNAWFMADLHRRGIEDPTVVSLFWNCLMLLVLLRLANAIIARLSPRHALSQAEMICFYILISVSTCASGLDTLKTNFATMQGYAYFASPENGWEDLFGDYVPASMTVGDLRALDRLWEGDSSFWDSRNLQVWLPPLVRWWVFFTFLWGAPAGLAVLFRKRWVERERMSFPIIQLPLEVSRPDVPSLSNRWFWVAFGLAAFVNILNGLHSLYPGVPQIGVKIGQSESLNLQRFFVGRPWNAVGRLHMCFYPFITGLGMLLPQDMSLSLWLFHLLWKAEAVLVSWLGWTGVREFPFMKEQSFGGYLAILGFSLWAARPYFRQLWRRIWGGGDPTLDAHEPLRYRNAFLIFLVGFVAVTLFGMSIKMAALVAVGFFLQYFFMTMIVGRIRAEMGLPTHELERLGPTVMQGNILGADILGKQNLTSLSLFFGFTRGLRNIPYPHMLEGLYVTERLGADSRRLLLATIFFVPLGTVAAYLSYLHLGYYHGIGADWNRWMPWSCTEAWRQLGRWLELPAGFDWGRTIAVVLGFAFYFGLQQVRTLWVWWPIHPAGFAISTTWYMSHMWTPMLVAWLTKSLVARYAGRGGVRSLAAVAFGLILGDVITGASWTIFSAITRVDTYAFWP